MRHTPRSVRLALALLACAFLHASHAYGGVQQSTQKKPGAKESAQAARTRRETREAVAALKEAAELARGFEDVYESVRAQAEAAEAVWPFDEQWARSVLRRAWDATNAPGAEDRVQGFGASEDPRENAFDALTTARRFVVKAALRHDPRFGEALMREFERGVAARSAEPSQGDTADSPEPDDDAATLHGRRRRLSDVGRQRLFVARQLLDGGDFRAAASVAAPVVAEGATPELLKFILDLREHDAGDADALYLRLLAWARADPLADANDVLLLSTPVVSPDLFIYIGADGSASFTAVQYQSGGVRAAAASLPAAARLALYDTAAAVLLRPRPARGDERTGNDAAAVYFAAGRLLPFFEREAPQLAPALSARLGSLAAELEASRRESLRVRMEVSSLSPKNPADPLALPLQLVSQATTPAARDFARLTVVTMAARLALWSRARTAAEEIEGAEARRAARLAVAIQQVATVRQAFEDEGTDASERADEFVGRAVDFVRAADVPPEARALGFARAAELAAGAALRVRADALLGEAAGLAAQADRGTQRASALALVTFSAASVGSGRVWEVLPAFVRAADEADELRYGAMLLEFNVGPSDRKLWVTAPGTPVSLSKLFAAAARLDALKTFAEARGFADEELRAAALLASGRAALEKNARPTRPDVR